MVLQWREQLSVGNDLIDTDHKHLIGIINQAELHLKSKNMTGLSTVIDSLSNYSKLHFAREELIAKSIGYPKADQLHVSHELLLTKLTDVKQKVGHELTEESGAHFGAFLHDWLISHVIKEDMLLKPYLVKLSPRFDPRK